MTRQVGKRAPPAGITPAVLLVNPKYPQNVGAALRACSCFGVRQLWFTGDRVRLNPAKGERLPREERMRGYADVALLQFDYPFEQYPRGTTPVCVELVRGAVPLPDFRHPERPLYVFGPEDGGVPQVDRRLCHQFVQIPSSHCLNLAAAVYTTLYDRMVKAGPPYPSAAEAEHRGWANTDDLLCAPG